MKVEAENLWNAYCAATGHSGPLPPDDQFGDTKNLGDELLALVLSGDKRATCELKIWFDNHDEALPKPGDHWIITNGSGEPSCIIKTTRVDILPVNQVDEEFAYTEGEGDKTLKWWKEAHDAYYERQAAQDGFTYDDSMLCVAERFELVWPQ